MKNRACMIVASLGFRDSVAFVCEAYESFGVEGMASLEF